MTENTLLRYFFSSGSEVDPEDRFHLNRKTRTRRLKEISDILRKHHFLKGFAPEAFRAMLEDLGPSFVKIGQTLSTRSEILPKAYCDELAKLQMECEPLPFEDMLAALDGVYGARQGDIFDAIDPTPLGSASLAPGAQGAPCERRRRGCEDPAARREGHHGAGHRHHAHGGAPRCALHEGRADARPARRGGRAVGHVPRGDGLRSARPPTSRSSPA